MRSRIRMHVSKLGKYPFCGHPSIIFTGTMIRFESVINSATNTFMSDVYVSKAILNPLLFTCCSLYYIDRKRMKPP